MTNCNEGYAGTWLLQHPIREREAYEREFTDRLHPYSDKTFRDACCNEGQKNDCNIFFNQRGIVTDDGYLSPALG